MHGHVGGYGADAAKGTPPYPTPQISETRRLSKGFALCNECQEKELRGERTPFVFRGHVLACSACLAWSRMRCDRPPASTSGAATSPTNAAAPACASYLQARAVLHGRQRYLLLQGLRRQRHELKGICRFVVSIWVQVRKSPLKVEGGRESRCRW